MTYGMKAGDAFNRPRRRFLPITPVAALLLAVAYFNLPPVSDPVYAEDAVSVSVQGSISPSCSISAPQPQLTIADLSHPGSAKLPLAMSCNAPFKYRMQSANGALRPDGVVAPVKNFLSAVPYQTRLMVTTLSGPSLDMCSSGNMTASSPLCGTRRFYEMIPQNAQGSLEISWDLDGSPLLAGAYHDTITITIAPTL